MRPVLRKCIIILFLFITQNSTAAVFFAAHPDDVVLFMGRNAYLDIKGGYSTVIVIVTAGDAGNYASPNIRGTDGNFDHNQQGKPYYRVRLDAHNAALQYWVSPYAPPMPRRTAERFSSEIPAVEKIIIGNVTLYNLNLPDGKLSDFFAGGIYPRMQDVTGVNTYAPASLRETLRQIISRNNMGRPTVVINLPEHDLGFSEAGYNELTVPDENGNLLRRIRIDTEIQDHPDHTAVGKFVMSAINENPAYRCLYRAVFMGYAIMTLPEVMTPFEKYNQEIAVFHRMNGVLIHQGNVISQPHASLPLAGHDDAFHRSFLGKQRWRDGGGGGVCAF